MLDHKAFSSGKISRVGEGWQQVRNRRSEQTLEGESLAIIFASWMWFLLHVPLGMESIGGVLERRKLVGSQLNIYIYCLGLFCKFDYINCAAAKCGGEERFLGETLD